MHASHRVRETDRAATKVWARPWRITRKVLAVHYGTDTSFRERPSIERGAFWREKSLGVGDHDGEVDEERHEERPATLDGVVLVGVLDLAVVALVHIPRLHECGVQVDGVRHDHGAEGAQGNSETVARDAWDDRPFYLRCGCLRLATVLCVTSACTRIRVGAVCTLAMATASGCAYATLMKKQMAMVRISTQMNASSLRAPHACSNKNVNVSAPVTVVCKIVCIYV